MGCHCEKRSDEATPMDLEQPRLPPIVLIAGPTASGKSALAIELARHFGGVIINADALQMYRDLRILSAQPNSAALDAAPHRLYGVFDAAERGSVARWLELARAEISVAHTSGRLPIVVGGTGLYLRALQGGLARVPPVAAEVRAAAKRLYDELGGVAFRERLRALDPIGAAGLPANDRQRLLRAFEVVRGTGRPLHEWQMATESALPYRFVVALLMPPRQLLYAACDTRFLAMIEGGGLIEAAALAARHLDPDLPAMKAVGVPELLRHLRGEIALDAAIAEAQRATRRYAKRQMTWFRHQLQPDIMVIEQFSESLTLRIRHFIDGFLLTGQTEVTTVRLPEPARSLRDGADSP
jgi:tRNA dimethylallyltransferase